jgi:survival-of-motor-neuron-related-splicing factor 30
MADSDDAEVAELQANMREYREQMEQVRGATSLARTRGAARARLRACRRAPAAAAAAALTPALFSSSPSRPQIEALLLDDPENAEYRGIYDGLAEVIQLTTDLLAESAAAAAAPAPAAPAPATAPAAAPGAPEVRVPSALPPAVAGQIRAAQQRAALAGQAPASWAVGAPVQAVFAGDGRWYDATIVAVAPSGAFIARYDEAGAEAEVERAAVRARGGGGAVAGGEGYRPVEAPKRKRVEEAGGGAAAPAEMPAWLEIKPTDDEKTKERKRKLQKSHKSKARFQKMDAEQASKADAWKKFAGGKKGKKKVKAASMFAVPEGGRVGVTGSGQAMTDYQRARRHEFDAAAAAAAGGGAAAEAGAGDD